MRPSLNINLNLIKRLEIANIVTDFLSFKRKSMKIAIFSEVGSKWGTKYPRNFPNMRTDCAWAVAMSATVYSFDSDIDLEFDLGIIIVPKKDPYRAIAFRDNNPRICKKWATMQEGNHSLYQDWSVSMQIEYMSFLSCLDIVYCHNEFDQRYYRGLLPGQDVRILPTLMIEDAICRNDLSRPEDRSGVMIGGNFVQWYSGIDSFIIATAFSGPKYIPSMGRRQSDETMIDGLEHIEYTTWSNWMTELSKRKYAVHLMRTIAAGSFALNCAYLGIPCIGYLSCDTQRNCFPELSVSLGDMETARKVAKHLAENQLFYDHVSAYAIKQANDIYSEQQFLKNFYEPFNL